MGHTYLHESCTSKYVHTYVPYDARNKDQKLIGHFLKWDILKQDTAVPRKMYEEFGRSEWTLVGQMLKFVGKWPVANYYF